MIGPAGSALDGGGSPGNKRASSPRPEAEVSEAVARRGIRADAACRRPTPRVPERTRASQTPDARGRFLPCGGRTDVSSPRSRRAGCRRGVDRTELTPPAYCLYVVHI